MSRTTAANLAWSFAHHSRRMDGLDLSWRERSACVDTDPNIFFTPELEELALSFCEQCPVTNECLAHAMRIHNRHEGVSGVWGGRSEVEVRRLLRSARR